MTMVRPCRLMTRQRSHMGLTDGRTFIAPRLLHSKGDSAASEVIGRELDLDTIAGEDADVVLTHLPRDPGENGMAVVELDPEHRRRKRFDDLAFDLDLLFLDCHFAREQTFRLEISSENSGTNGRPRRGGTS